MLGAEGNEKYAQLTEKKKLKDVDDMISQLLEIGIVIFVIIGALILASVIAYLYKHKMRISDKTQMLKLLIAITAILVTASLLTGMIVTYNDYERKKKEEVQDIITKLESDHRRGLLNDNLVSAVYDVVVDTRGTLEQLLQHIRTYFTNKTKQQSDYDNVRSWVTTYCTESTRFVSLIMLHHEQQRAVRIFIYVGILIVMVAALGALAWKKKWLAFMVIFLLFVIIFCFATVVITENSRNKSMFDANVKSMTSEQYRTLNETFMNSFANSVPFSRTLDPTIYEKTCLPLGIVALFAGLVASFMCFVMRKDENGDAILYVFAAATVLLITVLINLFIDYFSP